MDWPSIHQISSLSFRPFVRNDPGTRRLWDALLLWQVILRRQNVCVILSAEHMSPTAKPLPSSNFGLQLYRSAAVMPHNNSIALCCCYGYGVTMCSRNRPAQPSFTSTSDPRNLWNFLIQFVMLPWSMPSMETVHASPTCLLQKHWKSQGHCLHVTSPTLHTFNSDYALCH